MPGFVKFNSLALEDGSEITLQKILRQKARRKGKGGYFFKQFTAFQRRPLTE
jgi:hypothetical protein